MDVCPTRELSNGECLLHASPAVDSDVVGW
jgi:hypothetical protein